MSHIAIISAHTVLACASLVIMPFGVLVLRPPMSMHHETSNASDAARVGSNRVQLHTTIQSVAVFALLLAAAVPFIALDAHLVSVHACLGAVVLLFFVCGVAHTGFEATVSPSRHSRYARLAWVSALLVALQGGSQVLAPQQWWPIVIIAVIMIAVIGIGIAICVRM